MALGNIAGKPGTLTGYTATPIEIFWGTRPTGDFIPGPITIDGTVSRNVFNSPYTWLLQAGTLLGKDTVTGKYETSIIGVTTGAVAAGNPYVSGGTQLIVSPASAAEIARRVGSSGTLNTVGPPTANGVVAVTSTTFSAVNAVTGAITVSSLGVNKVVGSLILANDGSQTPLTVVCDTWGLKLTASDNVTSVDVYDAELFAGIGILDETKIIGWSTDTSIQAWIKAGIRTNFPGTRFKGDMING